MRRPRVPRSVQDFCVAKLGVRRGAIAALRVAQWAFVTADLGHVPTTVEYAEWSAIDERTGWRHRALLHEVFGDDWPRVVEQVAAELGSERSPAAARTIEVAL